MLYYAQVSLFKSVCVVLSVWCKCMCGLVWIAGSSHPLLLVWGKITEQSCPQCVCVCVCMRLKQGREQSWVTPHSALLVDFTRRVIHSHQSPCPTSCNYSEHSRQCRDWIRVLSHSLNNTAALSSHFSQAREPSWGRIRKLLWCIEIKQYLHNKSGVALLLPEPAFFKCSYKSV